MKEIDIKNKSALKEYLGKPPEQTHTKEELESLHACIRYTKQYLQNESLSKMDEEELIARPLPDIGNFHSELNRSRRHRTGWQ